MTIKDDKFLMPNGNVEVKAILEKDAPPARPPSSPLPENGRKGHSFRLMQSAVVARETLTATPNRGYHFKEWQVISGGVAIKDDKFLMPNDNVEVKAIFEKDAPPAPTEFIADGFENGCSNGVRPSSAA